MTFRAAEPPPLRARTSPPLSTNDPNHHDRVELVRPVRQPEKKRSDEKHAPRLVTHPNRRTDLRHVLVRRPVPLLVFEYACLTPKGENAIDHVVAHRRAEADLAIRHEVGALAGR